MKIPRGLKTFREICHFLPTKVKIFLKNAIFSWGEGSLKQTFSLGRRGDTLRPPPHTKLMYVFACVTCLFIYAQLIFGTLTTKPLIFIKPNLT